MVDVQLSAGYSKPDDTTCRQFKIYFEKRKDYLGAVIDVPLPYQLSDLGYVSSSSLQLFLTGANLTDEA